MKRSLRLLSVLLGLLFLLSFVVPVAASNDDMASADETFSLYNSNYDPEEGRLTVDMSFEMAKRGWVDLAPVMAEALESDASLSLDAGRVKLYFTPEAVKKCVEGGGVGLFLIEDLSPTEDSDTAETGDEPASSDGETVLKRYRISLGDISFDPGTVRVSMRVIPENAENVQVFAIDGEERTRIPSAYADKLVSFYPDSIDELLVVEAPEAPSGTPKVLYLAFAMLAAVLAASAVLIVLLKIGRL